MARDIFKNPPRYKTRFSAAAHLYSPSDSEVKEVHASLDKLKTLLPEGIDPEQQPTLLYIVGNLAVCGLLNLNDDGISITDGLRVYKGFEWQQINLEHNRASVVGFVVKAGLSEFGTDRIITEDEARAANQPCNIAIVVALWKVTDKDLVNYILQSAAPGSPTKDDLSFSFEVGFDDYSIVVVPKGSSNLNLVTQTIASSSPEFTKWDQVLRANRGSGNTKDGSRVGRVLVGDILPLGGGIVTIPAAAVKGITPIVDDPRAESPEEPEHEMELSVDDKVVAKTDVEYSYSSTQVTLNETDAAPFFAFAASIPDEYLYNGEGKEEGDKAKYGRENEFHVTSLFGILGTDPAPLRAALKGCGPVRVTMGKVSSFENDEKPYSVLKVDVESEDLHRLHALIKASCDCELTHPKFCPHLTLLYARKGMVKPYIGDTRFEGKTFTFSSLTFSPHTGDKVEIPLTDAPCVQTQPAQVYSAEDSVIPIEDQSDLMSASISLTKHLKLSPGWQERLAALQAQAGGNPLPQGVDVTLSDGRKLKGLKVFDAGTLELDKETSFQGVVITDMHPGVPTQIDETKLVHPRVGDVYPNVDAEKAAKDKVARDQQEAAQKAAYTDAALALNQAIAKLAELFTLFSQNTATASVLTTIPKSMTLDDLKTLQASVQTSDKIEDLKTAFANVALFAAELAKASEEMVKARKDAESIAATSKTTLDEVKAQLAALAQQHNDLVAAQAAAAAEQVYQERMASVSEIFAFDDETRAEIIAEIKTCADDAAFAKWMVRAQKLYKGWLKAEKAPPFTKKDGEKPGDKKDDKEPDGDDDDAKAAKAAKAALASAAAKITDTDIPNVIDVDASKGKSLKDRLMAIASKNMSIGGKTLEKLNEEANASVRKTG